MDFTKTAAFDAPHARGKPTKRGEWVNAKDGDNGAAVYWVAISACWRPWPDSATVYPTQAEAKKANIPDGRRGVRIVSLDDAHAERENAEEQSKDAGTENDEAEIAAESTDSDGDSPPETDVDGADKGTKSEQSVDPVGTEPVSESTQDTSTSTDSSDHPQTVVEGQTNGDADPPGGLTESTPGRTDAVAAALAKAHTNHGGESEQSVEPPSTEPVPPTTANGEGRNQQSMLDKIAKLLLQAEDAQLGDRPEEAAAYFDKAFALQAENGVSDAMLRSHRDDLNTKVDATAESKIVYLRGGYLPMQRDLLTAMAGAMQCDSVQWPQRNGKLKVQVFGMPDHLNRVRDMWGLLQPQAERAMMTAHPGQQAHSSDVTVFRRNYITGYGDEIAARIRKAEESAAKTSGALELYVSDRKRAAVALHAAHPRLGLGKVSVRQYNPDGYQKGRQDAKSAQLNRSLE